MKLDELIAEFEKKTPKTKQHYQVAVDYLPGGVSGSGKFMKPYPLYIKDAQGCRLVDLDGNEYIDMLMGNGVNILGHANEKIDKAVKQHLNAPPFTFVSNEAELELTKKIIHHVESMEMLRLANTGSESVHMCTRAAMAYTGRQKIAKFEGHFHGSHELFLLSCIQVDGPESNPRPIRDSAGIPDYALSNTIILPFNNTEASVNLIERHASELAAVILEPVTGFMMGCVPVEKGFLQAVREVTQRHNILLIFDEIVTGFRLGLGGAAEYFGVKPDMHTFGKAISGGFPIGCYGGKKEIMTAVVTPTKEPSDVKEKIFQSGTFTGHPTSMVAGIAAITELEKANVPFHLNKLGDDLRDQIRNIAEKHNVALQVTGAGSMFYIHFCDHPIRNKRDAMKADKQKGLELSLRLLVNGVYWPHAHPALLSAAHTKNDIDYFLDRIDQAIFEIAT
jgi:glutamate-1-semialdehyde 2,1-aminomutase